MKLFLLIITVLIFLFCSQKEKSDDQLLSMHLKSSEVLPDTIKISSAELEDIGRVEILSVENDILLKTKAGTKVFENLFEKDVRLQEYSLDLIYTQKNNDLWTSEPIIQIGNCHVGFVVRGVDHYPHFFVAYQNMGDWKLLCVEQSKTCSFFGISPFCVIADKGNARLLIQYNGLAYDEELDENYKTVVLVQYDTLSAKIIGELRLPDAVGLECGPKGYKEWYSKYLKIAKQTSFSGYLN